MTWFFVALAAPFLWALVNIADNYLVSRFSEKDKEKSSGGLVLFSSLIGIVVALSIYLFKPHVLQIPFFDKALLLSSGILTAVWIILYLFSLEIEDASNVVPWFLSVPIIGYILGYLLLGETLETNQILGGIIIFIGLGISSLDLDSRNRKSKKHVLYMVFACLSIALSGILFKYAAMGNDFWISSFWEYFGLGIAGIVIFLSMPH